MSFGIARRLAGRFLERRRRVVLRCLPGLLQSSASSHIGRYTIENCRGLVCDATPETYIPKASGPGGPVRANFLKQTAKVPIPVDHRSYLAVPIEPERNCLPDRRAPASCRLPRQECRKPSRLRGLSSRGSRETGIGYRV